MLAGEASGFCPQAKQIKWPGKAHIFCIGNAARVVYIEQQRNKYPDKAPDRLLVMKQDAAEDLAFK